LQHFLAYCNTFRPLHQRENFVVWPSRVTLSWLGLTGAALASSIDILASLQTSDAHRLLVLISTAQVAPECHRDVTIAPDAGSRVSTASVSTI
jgi:hypothetical protein